MYTCMPVSYYLQSDNIMHPLILTLRNNIISVAIDRLHVISECLDHISIDFNTFKPGHPAIPYIHTSLHNSTDLAQWTISHTQ